MRQYPSLDNSGMTYVSDDVWQTPRMQLHTQSADDSVIEYVEDLAGQPFAIQRHMLADPQIVKGLTMAGNWLRDFPFDPSPEELVLVNAFRLGDLAVRVVNT